MFFSNSKSFSTRSLGSAQFICPALIPRDSLFSLASPFHCPINWWTGIFARSEEATVSMELYAVVKPCRLSKKSSSSNDSKVGMGVRGDGANGGKSLHSSFSGRCARLFKEQRARFYIMRRCVTMLLCWREYACEEDEQTKLSLTLYSRIKELV
ncbi:hypothetical protein ABZP36_014714 [Zizania latifolia]